MRVLAFFAASLCLGLTHAAGLRPLLKAGFDLGGDTMVSAVFTNGESETIKANEGFYVGGGAALIDAARNIEVDPLAAGSARLLPLSARASAASARSSRTR